MHHKILLLASRYPFSFLIYLFSCFVRVWELYYDSYQQTGWKQASNPHDPVVSDSPTPPVGWGVVWMGEVAPSGGSSGGGGGTTGVSEHNNEIIVFKSHQNRAGQTSFAALSTLFLCCCWVNSEKEIFLHKMQKWHVQFKRAARPVSQNGWFRAISNPGARWRHCAPDSCTNRTRPVHLNLTDVDMLVSGSTSRHRDTWWFLHFLHGYSCRSPGHQSCRGHCSQTSQRMGCLRALDTPLATIERVKLLVMINMLFGETEQWVDVWTWKHQCVNLSFKFLLWFFHILEVLLPLQNIAEQNWLRTRVSQSEIFCARGFEVDVFNLQVGWSRRRSGARSPLETLEMGWSQQFWLTQSAPMR